MSGMGEGRVRAITGAGRGIGRARAEALVTPLQRGQVVHAAMIDGVVGHRPRR